MTEEKRQFTQKILQSPIYPKIGYKCVVFPFWKSHTIETDSLQFLQMGNLMVGCFNQIGLNPVDSTLYIQNIGLYQFNMPLTGGPGVLGSELITLLSFNGNSDRVGIIHNKFPAPIYGSKIKYGLITEFNKKEVFNDNIFDLRGIKIAKHGMHSSIIVIAIDKNKH
jgi:hypothetical protein